MPGPPSQNPVPTPSFVATVANIAGSPNQLGTVSFLDAAGNSIKVERIVVNAPNGDVIASVDALGGLAVNVQQDSTGFGEVTILRRLMEQLLLEIQSLNANFLAANPGLIGTQAQDTSTVQ